MFKTFIAVIAAFTFESLILSRKSEDHGFRPWAGGALHHRDDSGRRPAGDVLTGATGMPMGLQYLKANSFKFSESAIITGLIVGYVISADEAWWKFVLASILAILSKHLFRIHKRHIFNPAAFGIFLTIILFNAVTQWKGTYAWYIIVPLGFYFIYKTNKIEVIIGYAVTSLILFGAQAYLQKVNLLNVFGYFSYFYIFVMAIEPKTTPIKKIGKLIFGISLGALIFILTTAGVKIDAELFSLLAMNAAVPFLNKLGGKEYV